MGLMTLLGVLPAAGLLLGLAGTLAVAMFRSLYHRLALLGIVLLACVFIEPSPSDIILAAVIPLGLVTGIYKPRFPMKASTAVLLLAAYFIASLPGIASSVDPGAAVRFFLITFYLFLLALFISTYATGGNISSLLRAYVLAAFVSLAAGIAGLLGLFPDLLMADPYRVKGLFKDPNVFGPFFVPAVVLLLDDIKRKRIWKANAALHAAAAALLALGVVFSYSRAAWINLAVACGAYFLLNLKAFHPRRLLMIAPLLAAALALAAFLSVQPGEQAGGVLGFLQERARLQDYDKNRFGAQQGGLELIARYPLGVGPGQFEDMIAAVTGMRLSAHSLYVRTAVENGAAGFLLVSAAMAVILLQLWRKQRAGPYGCGVSPAVLIAVLAGILVNSLVVDTLHWRHFWFFIGIALYSLGEARKKVNGHV